MTSLLHRINTTEYGVEVTPVLSFDERGHQKNHTTYFVYGYSEKGDAPEAFYPTVQEFIGEGGTYLNPEAVRKNKPGRMAGSRAEGKEAMGGIRFADVELKPQETAGFIILAGLTEKKESIAKTVVKYRTEEQVENVLEEMKSYWQKKVNVSNNHISSIETGKQIPSLTTFVKICEQLDTTPDFLYWEACTRTISRKIFMILLPCATKRPSIDSGYCRKLCFQAGIMVADTLI